MYNIDFGSVTWFYVFVWLATSAALLAIYWGATLIWRDYHELPAPDTKAERELQASWEQASVELRKKQNGYNARFNEALKKEKEERTTKQDLPSTVANPLFSPWGSCSIKDCNVCKEFEGLEKDAPLGIAEPIKQQSEPAAAKGKLEFDSVEGEWEFDSVEELFELTVEEAECLNDIVPYTPPVVRSVALQDRIHKGDGAGRSAKGVKHQPKPKKKPSKKAKAKAKAPKRVVLRKQPPKL